MKQNIISCTFSALFLLCGLCILSCSSDDTAPGGEVWDAPSDNNYTLTVTLTKNAMTTTRALTESGDNIVATWNEGDEIEVWSKEFSDTEATYKMGTIKARGTGSTVVFSGTLTTANAEYISNWITSEGSCPIYLSYLGSPFNYNGQDGSLETIARKYDYAYSAQINATAIDTSKKTITINGDVSWENQQAIVKFVFKDAAGNNFNPDMLWISAKDGGNNDIIYTSYNETLGSAVSQTTPTLTVLPDGTSNEVYVALNTKGSTATYTFKARSNYTNYYTGTFSGKTPFGKGGYYTVNVKMTPTNNGKTLNPLTVHAVAAGTITFDNTAAGQVEYSKDMSTWTAIAAKTTGTIDVAAGELVYFRGNNNDYYESNISCSSDFYVYGNIMSLISSTGFANATTLSVAGCFDNLFADNPNLKSHPTRKLLLQATTLSERCYQRLFKNCPALTTCPIEGLPATTLTDYCYDSMFENCSSLTEAPTLSALTMKPYCYTYMFRGCSSLAAAPTLPATTLANDCYNTMFAGCTSLTTAPSLNVETLEEYCYKSMFSGCTKLTATPALPARTLKKSCYDSMFEGCSSITSIGTISATTLAESCCSNMFAECTKITAAPSFIGSATPMGEYTYSGMFKECTSLTSVPASLPNADMKWMCCYTMFQGCTSLTTAPALPATTLDNGCYRSMFQGCTSLTTAPDLPATTMKSDCYMKMFSGCTSLTKAPDLPATSLTTGCYDRMFTNCSNLNYVKCLATSSINSDRSTNGWLSGVAATGTFVKAANVTWPEGSNGIPTGWTTQNAQ